MKALIIIIALLFLLKPVFPVIEFAANYEYISKVLCENKAKPQLHCNGKCHLVKELAKMADSEKPISSDKKISKSQNELLFYQELPSSEADWHKAVQPSQISADWLNLYGYLDGHASFRPPIFYV